MTGPRGAAAVVLSALLFSSGGLFIKLAPMPALAVVCGRAAITAAFFLIVFRPRLREARWSTSLCYAAMIATFVIATKTTTAANAIFLQYTAPAYVLLLSPWLLREPFRPRDAVLVALSFAGMALVFGDHVEAGQKAGNVVAAVSGVCFAFTLVLLRRDAAESGGVVTASTTLGNLIAAAAALPFAFGDLSAALAPRGLAVLLYLGVVQMGVGYALLNRGLREVPATTAALISMVEPVMNPIWVLLGTGERPGAFALAGGAIVLGVAAARAVIAR